MSDVRFDNGWLEIGGRFGGADFTKGGRSFRLPFPDELRPLLQACVAGRAEGPLLLRRSVFEGAAVGTVGSRAELESLLQSRLAAAGRGALTLQDRKRVFRGLLEDLGGVTEDSLAREFGKGLAPAGLPKVRFYETRSSVTTAMNRTPGMPHLELRYLTLLEAIAARAADLGIAG